MALILTRPLGAGAAAQVGDNRKPSLADRPRRVIIAPRSLLPAHGLGPIAAMLGTLDDRIALLRETNATLEAIAQALFIKPWFVDFDPVRAKSQGLAPAGMDEATAALFPDSLQESALGLVPKGWRAAPLVKAFEINPTRTLNKGTTLRDTLLRRLISGPLRLPDAEALPV